MAAFQEEKLPSKLNLSVWLKIAKYALLHKWLILGTALLMTFATFYGSAFVPAMSKAAIDAFDGDYANWANTDLWSYPLTTKVLGIPVSMTYLSYLITFGVMIFARALIMYWAFYLADKLSLEIILDLRRASMEKIEELSFSYFDKTSSGWLIARIQSDTSSIGDVLSWSVQSVLWSVFDLVFTLVTMFTIDWRLSLIVLATTPLGILVIPLFDRWTLKTHRAARNAYSYYVGYMAESISGQKTVKALGIGDDMEKEADEIVEDIRKKRWKAGVATAFFGPSVSLISSLIVSLVIYLGLAFHDASPWRISASTTILFIGFTGSVFDPISQFASSFSDFMASQAGAEKLMQLLEEKPTIQDSPEVVAKYGDLLHPKKENYEPIHGDVEFQDVCFSYGNGKEILHHINLKIPQGTSLAIVGETGAGKTTLVNLLCRFYEPTSGRVLIDGVDARERSLGWLRSGIAYVQQSPFLFAGSYFDNIAYGKDGATLEEVKKAASLAGIDAFISAQPEGYYSEIPDGGSSLSQGQKQLISYARAILRDPAILILDEATSSIDTKTERELQETTRSLLRGRTSIMIDHRLSTIVDADRIVLVENGAIQESGTHRELMEKKGLYYRLYLAQFQDLSLGEQIQEYEKNVKEKGVKIS